MYKQTAAMRLLSAYFVVWLLYFTQGNQWVVLTFFKKNVIAVAFKISFHKFV